MIELSEVGEPNSDTIPEVSSVQEQCTQELIPRRSSRIPVPPERYVGHIQGQKLEDEDPQTYLEAI